jgi:hypothetical protein
MALCKEAGPALSDYSLKPLTPEMIHIIAKEDLEG